MQLIGKWLERVELALLSLGALATFAMMCLTSADAFSRYLLKLPITGAYEITEKYLMVAAIFLGLSYAYRGGGFIRVTFLVDRLPGTWKLAADYLAHLVSLLFCLIFIFATARQALRALSESTELSALPILVGPAYCLVPLGFFFLCVLLIADIARVRSRKSFMLTQDAPTT